MLFAWFMVLDDKSFPGPHDKLVWVTAFLLAFPVAPFVFMVWNNARKSYFSAARASDETINPKRFNPQIATNNSLCLTNKRLCLILGM